MGMMRLFGQKGFAVNLAEGVRLLQLSASKADLDAPQGAYVFALLLAEELQVAIPPTILPPDVRGSRAMLEKASFLGLVQAQNKLGSAYENGTFGCGYDPLLSVHYYTLAAKQGLSRQSLN
jgi:TPR repeat protein